MRRDDFLAAVGRAARAADLPPVDGTDPGLLVPELNEVDLVAHFAAAVEMADGSVHSGDPVASITAIVERLDVDRYLGWDPDRLPVPGIGEALAGSGLTRIPHRTPAAPSERLAHLSDYMDVELGVTGAEAGFAETGTIVVRSGAGRPRMASLICAVHVALLPRAAIRRSLAHWVNEDPTRLADDTNVVFITGPSRTGDIEMRLNTGVHGPREVHVVLV